MKIWGHRGARGYAPENTMPSFQKALSLGVYGIELDIHMSKDGELVICHDHTLERTSNGQGYINSFTLKELKKLDFGSWFNLAYPQEQILTLHEFLVWFTPTPLYLNIEIKNGPVIYDNIEQDFMHPYWQLLDTFWINDAKNLNISINAYTINLPAEYQLALSMNIDGIFSDYPDRWL